jgi:hypothetical protein
MLDEGEDKVLVIEVFEIILSHELREIDEIHVGPVLEIGSNPALSGGFWSDDEHGLGEDRFLGQGVDLTDAAFGIDLSDFTESFVVFDDWFGLISVLLDSLLDNVCVVVWPATGISPLGAPIGHRLLRQIVNKDLLALEDILLEILGLVSGPWESIN